MTSSCQNRSRNVELGLEIFDQQPFLPCHFVAVELFESIDGFARDHGIENVGLLELPAI
jgi:hypothetical protein